jgi:hypothetical protein
VEDVEIIIIPSDVVEVTDEDIVENELVIQGTVYDAAENFEVSVTRRTLKTVLTTGREREREIRNEKLFFRFQVQRSIHSAQESC